jgi:hypothetical protein
LLPIWNFCPQGLLAGSKASFPNTGKKGKPQTTTIVHTLLLTKNHQKHKPKNPKPTSTTTKTQKTTPKQQNNPSTHPTTQKKHKTNTNKKQKKGETRNKKRETTNKGETITKKGKHKPTQQHQHHNINSKKNNRPHNPTNMHIPTVHFFKQKHPAKHPNPSQQTTNQVPQKHTTTKTGDIINV